MKYSFGMGIITYSNGSGFPEISPNSCLSSVTVLGL